MNYTGKQSKQSIEPTQKVAQTPTVSAFADQRASTAMQLKQQQIMHAAHSPNVIQQMTAEEEPIQGEFEKEAPTQLQEAPAAKPNNTGLPDNLKTGIENLSGYAMDDVKVHFNSDKPAQLNAHAYAQGTDIHVAPGQEQHLPHEAWHVVQQKQERVQATMQMKAGVPVNDDAGLENEADVMGEKALAMSAQVTKSLQFKNNLNTNQCNISGYTFQLATKIKHTVGTIPFGGNNYLVGKKMEATLNPAEDIKGSATTADNYDWMKGIRAYYPAASVIRGHLLNHDLGGYGVPENLYPISSLANSDHSNNVEQKVKGALSNAANKKNTEITYSVEVNENGPSLLPYENAQFQCKWTDENGKSENYTVNSQLNIDKGWGGKGANPNKSPTKWRHGSRRGEEDMQNKINNNQIAVDYSKLGMNKNAISTLRLATVKSSGIDAVEDWSEALKMLGNELDELATVADPKNPPKILLDGGEYLKWIDGEVKKHTTAGTLANFYTESNRMMNNLIAIRKERIYLQDGVDSESNIADEPADVEMAT